MLLIWISSILFLLYASLIVFYRWSWMSMPRFKLEQRPHSSYQTKVSVIIPARNETVNIANCIRSVLAQSYPASLIEIIVVDDHSTDDTTDIAHALSLAYTNVHLIKLNETLGNMAYKKRGIEAGIARATGTLIVTTDADCTHPEYWLETLVQYQEQTQAQFIAAPVVYLTKNKLLSVFQCLDFMTMQGITGASVFKRFHSMCNGANLAYTKAAFEAVNGFAGIDKLPTGDDMLLMHKIYKQHPQQVVYLKSQEAIVSTHPAYSWKEFFNQRIRWASKATHYDDKRIFATLLLVYIFNVWFLVLAVAAFFSWKWLVLLAVSLVGKTLVEIWFLKPVAGFFGMDKWLGWFPFLQPLHILYVVISGWLGKFGKYEWKGREIRQKP
ncbi:MAG: glycosyltransferase [Chitinophagaceae bacterium]